MPHLPRKKMLRTCGNHWLTKCWGNSSLVFGQACVTKKGRASLPAPNSQANCQILSLEDSHDLEGPRIDHDDLAVDEDELISTPLRIDRHDFPRKRVEPDVARHAGADRDREVDVGERLNVLLPDYRGDPGPLFGRELCGSAGLSGRLRLQRRSTLRLRGRLSGLRGRLIRLRLGGRRLAVRRALLL